jgi:Arsenical pump membrane protein
MQNATTLRTATVRSRTRHAARYATGWVFPGWVAAQPSLMHATLIGVDLGPNLAVTGSPATILWLLALRKEKRDVTFWAFLKVGAIAMPVAFGAATLGSIASDALWGNASDSRPMASVELSQIPTPEATP